MVSVSTIGVKRDKEATKIWKAGMNEAIRRVTPKPVVVYGGDIGYHFPCRALYFDNAVTEKMKSGKGDGR
ncbi:MAG: DUF4417 domain-containing protein [Acidaminococcaceae bacterium]|nr:DUF4417 domain-containing protein [Acidaminococcaceae bacterium]